MIRFRIWDCGFRIYNFGMGTFYIKCKVENIADRKKSAVIPKILVDTGSELTWIAANTLEKIDIEREKKDVPFVMANGQKITRSVGFAIIRYDKFFTVDEVVFAEKGDLLLLGARTLEGLSLTVDAKEKKLVASGPIPAA
ncbi:MAG TPA: hypothetical protein VK892_23990 [Pyrinomonadaceae bacterium]|nr:hypothetical protein [Pyrinomonadaceae bacterium]